MTESTDSAAVPPPAYRRLYRPNEGRMLGGVAAGLARYTDVDPVIYRVAFAVLAVFGGAGVLLYLVALLLMPREGAPSGLLDRFLSRRDPAGSHHVLIALAVVAGVVAVAGLTWTDREPWLLLAAAIVALILLLHDRDERREGGGGQGPGGSFPPAGPGAGPTGSGTAYRTAEDAAAAPTLVGAGATTAGWAAPAGPTAPTPPPAGTGTGWAPAAAAAPTGPARPRVPLFTVTAGVALLVAGLLASLALAGVGDVDGADVLAGALGVVALGLLAGTWFGVSWRLVALGVLLCVGLSIARALPGDLSWSAGDRTWQPATVQQLRQHYALGAGDARLDLRDLDVIGTRHVDARVGAGRLWIDVPQDVDVEVHASASVGQVQLFGRTYNGLGVEHDTVSAGTTGTGRLVLDLKVGAGEVVVDRAA